MMTMTLERTLRAKHRTGTLKIYSLLHFRRALLAEAYEECTYWKDLALRTGATKKTLSRIIRNPQDSIEQ